MAADCRGRLLALEGCYEYYLTCGRAAGLHIVSDAFGLNPDGASLTIGLMKYF
jgi:hypothetical protein